MNKVIVYEPSPKSKQAFRASKRCRYLLLEGAVRSAKSYTTNDAFLDRLESLPICNVLISGYSSGAVARNVIAEWKKALGADKFKTTKTDKDEFLTINHKGLKGKKFYIRGAGKANDFEQLQGATFGAWLCDEATRHSESFIDMAISRLSLDYSFAIWTMNPDGPFHYIKTRFLDNPDLFTDNENGYSQFKKIHFDLDDNPSLGEEYKENIKLSYSGVFYDRYILGKWVKAEGLVFPNFDPNRHILPIDQMPTQYQELRVGIDFGVQNPNVFALWGRRGDNWYCIDEYYHTGRTDGQKTMAKYKNDLVSFYKKHKLTNKTKVICDPSATPLKVELREAGFKVHNGKNEVLEGVQYLSNLIGKDRFYISEVCTNAKKEALTYSWNEKKGEKGEDVPLKENDHWWDASRYAIYTKLGGLR